MYASLTDLTDSQPVFSGSSYSDKVLITKLRTAARFLDGRLARHYSIPVSVAASGTLTFSGNVSADDTVTVGGTTYTFKAAPGSADEVDVGSSATQSAINLSRAINQGTNGGSYHSDTTINTEASASRSELVLTITSRKDGPEGNDIGLSTTAGNITASAAYLSGGLREFDALTQLNVWIASKILLMGQTNAALGKGNTSLLSDIQKAVDDYLLTTAQNGGLIDTTGTTRDPLDAAFASSSEDGYPFADTQDPIHWDYFDDTEYTRD